MTNAKPLVARAQYRVLAIDAEPAMRQVLASLLGELCRVSLASSGEEALRTLQTHQVDLLLVSAELPGMAACRDVIVAARRIEPELAILVLTSNDDDTHAYEGTSNVPQSILRSEAGRAQLLVCIDRLAREVCRKREATFRDQRPPKLVWKDSFVGATDAAKRLREQIEDAAQSDFNVLLTGETGVGKTLVAAAIHERWCGPDKAPFVVCEPATMSSSLFESELFGHAQGAFTGAASLRRGAFEAAHGGSIFLDEIGEVALSLQAKLLRVVEDKVIKRLGDSRDVALDVRVIAATNRVPESEVSEGRFRADLYQRLNELRVHVPPLRDRRADIVPLLQHFLAQDRDAERAPFTLDAAARQWLESYHWPGNVRELRTLARRLARIDLPALVSTEQLSASFPVRRAQSSALSVEARVAAFGRELYLEELAKHAFNVRETARAIGVPYPTLRSRLKALDLIDQVNARKRERR